METPDLNPSLNNSSEIPINNPEPAKPAVSEFADKQPLMHPKRSGQIKMAGMVVGGLVLLTIAGLIIYRLIPSSTPVAPEPIANASTPTPEPVQKDKPLFAYIKDKQQIWTADTDGGSKKLAVEISPSLKEVYTTLAWKAPYLLTYSECSDADAKGMSEDTTATCKVKTIDIKTNSISNEISSGLVIKKLVWSSDGKYLAYIGEDLDQLYYRLKTGTITATLNSFYKDSDPGNVNSRVFFTSQDQYLVFSSSQITKDDSGSTTVVSKNKIINTYLLNGTKIDEIQNAEYPFMITDTKMGYKKNNTLAYREIGQNEETSITPFTGFNPTISPNKNQIAYWYYEGNLNNVILGVFDSELNINRNILRGIVLPYWLSDDKILGIKADNCLGGDNCQLYQFQTNSISIVDVQRGNVIQIDQGKNIVEPAYIPIEDSSN